ncbi:MAG: hypothetical protein SH859_05505 [Hyphomicrobium aestuarii]|nr:hypothetical protein [Hyphomicrobium aestuarii]
MRDTLTRVMPSAAPTDAEIKAWQALPRDEQLARLREALNHPDSSVYCGLTMEEIKANARKRVAQRGNG